MVEVVDFLPQHVSGALALWQRVAHIGLNPLDDQPDRLEKFLARNPGCSFVALQDSKLVGACLCGHDLRRGAIYHLAVDPERRRSGVGRELLAGSLAALRRAGVVKCHALVFKDNPYAEKFWAQAGWVLRDELLLYSRSAVENETR